MIEMFPIQRTLAASDRYSDYVALANYHENEIAVHSAFVIHYSNEIMLFHYTGTAIKFSPINREYFHRVTDLIDPEEVPSFIAMCKNVQSKADPQYGYFYSGESYDSNGNHSSDSYVGERMTCVGFCLNILKGFLEEDYINFKEWNEDTHEKANYLEEYCKKHNLDIQSIQPSHRRITPRECLASAFFKTIPIPKVNIDERVIFLNDYFQNLFKRAKPTK